MIRRGFTYYLALIALAGPGMCCCSYLQAWTAFPDCSSGRGQASECHGHSIRHSCCHHPSKKGSSTQNQCPCREHQAVQAAFLTERSGQSEINQPSAIWQSFEIGPALLPGSLFIQVNGQRIAAHSLESPYLTSKGILRALHIMRC